MDDPPPAAHRSPVAGFYAVNGRPVQLVPTPEGGLDVLALNMRTGEFERDMGYLSRCIIGEGDVHVFPDEAAFLARVGKIRARIDRKKDAPAPANRTWVAAGVPVWWCVVTAHFLCMIGIAHWLGDPTRLPAWLKPIDTFLVYQISNTQMIVFEILWLFGIGVVGVAMASVPRMAARAADRLATRRNPGVAGEIRQARAGLAVAAKVMFLPITISLTTLAIMPISAGARPGDTAMLAAGTTMPLAEFVAGVSQQSYMVFMALLLLLAFYGVISAMIRWLPESDGFWQLPVAALIALVAAIATGGLLFKVIYPVVEHARGAAVTCGLFGFYSLLSVLTSMGFAVLRKGGKQGRVVAGVVVEEPSKPKKRSPLP